MLSYHEPTERHWQARGPFALTSSHSGRTWPETLQLFVSGFLFVARQPFQANLLLVPNVREHHLLTIRVPSFVSVPLIHRAERGIREADLQKARQLPHGISGRASGLGGGKV